VALQPLAGIRILSLAEQYPGPYATMILADLGADVILVERPGKGDPARRFPGLWAAFSRNKRSVTIDLKSPPGKAQFLELVDGADAVIEGFRPGVMQRLGLDAASLQARRPGLVFASISSFGQTGPNALVAGHDLSLQGAAGMIDVPTGAEAQYQPPVLPLADISSAMFAVIGIVSALLERTRSGRGHTVDVSMHEALVSWMTPFLVPPANNLPIRPLPPPEPAYRLFGTADGRQLTLSIAGEDHMWDQLCEMLGLPQFCGLDEATRMARCDELTPPVRAAVARFDYATLVSQLQQRGLAYGPIVRPQDVLTDPHLTARGMTVGVAAEPGRVYLRQPIVFDGESGGIEQPVPDLGQHNGEIFNTVK